MSFFPNPVEIGTVSGGVVQFGPSVFTSPKNAIKTMAGAGSENVGALINTVTGVNSTNTLDSDGLDQPIVQGG
jgi:spore germination protein PF